MEFTTHFELQSQTTRLVENNLRRPGKYGSLTLSAALFQGTLPGVPCSKTAVIASTDHNSVQKNPAQIHSVSSSRFSRPY